MMFLPVKKKTLFLPTMGAVQKQLTFLADMSVKGGKGAGQTRKPLSTKKSFL